MQKWLKAGFRLFTAGYYGGIQARRNGYIYWAWRSWTQMVAEVFVRMGRPRISRCRILPKSSRPEKVSSMIGPANQQKRDLSIY